MHDNDRSRFSRDFLRLYDAPAPTTHSEWKEREKQIRSHLSILGYPEIEPVLPYSFFMHQDVDLLWHDTKTVHAEVYKEISMWVLSHT